MMLFRFLLVFLVMSCVKENVEKEKHLDIPDLKLDSTVQVINVNISGSPMTYNFSVELASPDVGCEQYADWWEVLTTSGNLIYRRNLSHSHVDEQPFTRSGGPVMISAFDSIIVRGHMNNLGYGSVVMRGNIDGGLLHDTLTTSFSEELALELPLPPKCAF